MDELPEILQTYSRDGLYYASIRQVRTGDDRVFELGISEASHRGLTRVLEMRPFDQIPGVKYRYFFEGNCARRDDPERCMAAIRIEQGRDGRVFEALLPMPLIENLLWFLKMKTHRPAKHLRSWSFNDDSGWRHPLPPAKRGFFASLGAWLCAARKVPRPPGGDDAEVAG